MEYNRFYQPRQIRKITAYLKSVLLNKQVKKFWLRVLISLNCSTHKLKVQFQKLTFGSQAPLIGPPGGASLARQLKDQLSLGNK